jgi:selenocysteine-specific elongation factor
VYVIATAGHVDHGKSTLIRALTGMEPDRWAEERRRGMTIDLGYAWTRLPGGSTVAFVDVPGHERFVSNMLAGVGPVPAVLFVVAADEGWRAQSTEHLEVLVALGVHHGVLALTRSDLGDAELAEAEARDRLAGTALADMEAVAVSPVTGEGLGELRDALDRLTVRMPPPAERPTRLWVDRVFTMRGSGTVVTGTLSSGTLKVGQDVELRPSGEVVRVRSLESLKAQVEHADAPARVAVNLRGVKPTQIRRGHALTAPGSWADVSVMDVRLFGAGARELPGELVLHVGSAAVPTRVRPLDADLARLTLRTPLPLHIGERLVLRDPGRHQVAAGAVVLDSMPPALTRRGDAGRRAEALSTVTGEPDLIAEVGRRGAVRRSDLARAGVPAEALPIGPAVVEEGDWLVDRGLWSHWGVRLIEAVADWARAHPLEPGMPRRAAVGAVRLPAESLLDPLVRTQPQLRLDARGLHHVDAPAGLPADAEQQLAELIERLSAAPFDVPETYEFQALGLTEKVLAAAARHGRVVRVATGIYLLPEAIDEAATRLAELDQPFTVAAARAALGTTRRVAVPLLEYLDRLGRTRRIDSRLRSVGGG